MSIDFTTATFKDFENINGMDAFERAAYFSRFLDYLAGNGRLNYRLEVTGANGPVVDLVRPGEDTARSYVSLVSNDYLGFSQHPKVKAAVIRGTELYGCGSGASPAIGGHYRYHAELEKKIASFFGHEEAILYTTGYTANSASFQALLQKEDIAILDMAVHASVYEGCQLSNVRTFLHNNLEHLEKQLKGAQGFRTKMVIVDGVYSQDGDLARLPEIARLCRRYGAYLAVDDAHGVGVIGATGRGVLEHYGMGQEVDIITGTFSKTFGGLGGHVVASPEIVRFLKYQSKQHLFSVSATPAALGILQAIDLIDEEPHCRVQLAANSDYLREGLRDLGLNIGTTAAAVIPVKVGAPAKAAHAAQILLDHGVYANPIMYPAVARKDARVRMCLMATHTRAHLDQVLSAWAKARRVL